MENQQNSFGASALTTLLVVADIKKSKAFYTEVLGASVYREYGGHSVVLQLLDTWLLLVLPGGPTNDKPGVHFKPTRDKQVVNHSFTLRVQDCQKAYAILIERGVDFLTPPVSSGNETRCFFYDPDGHLFEISEYRAND